MSSNKPVMTTDIPGLQRVATGKVREIYDLGETYLFVASDRISAFDVVMPNGVPDKGRVLNQLSAFWFESLEAIVPHHLITINDSKISHAIGSAHEELRGRCALVKKAKTIPVECVVRGYLSGSLFKEYAKRGGKILGLDLPDGLQDGSQLPEPIFTPATKAESGHDENIPLDQMKSIVGRETSEFLREKSLEIYHQASVHASQCGYILADTKFEFGTTDRGIIWIDEALTPDSSRYWEAATWAPGGSQPSSDKQFVRDYLETLDWNKQPPGPILPDSVIATTRNKYLEAFRRLTGRDLNA